MKRTIAMALGGLGMLLAFALAHRALAEGRDESAARGVVSIELPLIPTNLPPGPNREVVATCNLCHSARYILDQPPLPRKTWTAEVDKMRKTFGAPIADAQAAQIVDYCVAVRGAKDPSSK